MPYKDEQAYKEYHKRYYQEHKEELTEWHKRYRQAHKDEKAERNACYRQENKEKISDYRKRYYQEHKEDLTERQKHYRQAHKEELAEYHARYRQTHQRRFKKFGTKIIDTKISPMDAYKRFGGLCWICGGLCEPNDKFINCAGRTSVGASYPTKDHITPIAKGGEESWDNVLLAHKSCNAWRGTKSVEEVKKELENPATLEMLRRRLTKKEVVL